MKFTIEDNTLKMEIDADLLKHILKHDPENTYDGENEAITVKQGKDKEFLEYIVEKLKDMREEGPLWGGMFSQIFMEAYEGADEAVFDYYEDDAN